MEASALAATWPGRPALCVCVRRARNHVAAAPAASPSDGASATAGASRSFAWHSIASRGGRETERSPTEGTRGRRERERRSRQRRMDASVAVGRIRIHQPRRKFRGQDGGRVPNRRRQGKGVDVTPARLSRPACDKINRASRPCLCFVFRFPAIISFVVGAGLPCQVNCPYH